MDEGLKRFWWGSPQKNHKKYCVRKFFQKEGFMRFFLEDSGFRDKNYSFPKTEKSKSTGYCMIPSDR